MGGTRRTGGGGVECQRARHGDRPHASSDELRREIDRTRALTAKPFGVNLTLPLLGKEVRYDDWVDAIARSGVQIVETAGNNPQAVITTLKAHGIKVIHKCTTVRHALSAERLGVDVISIDGFGSFARFTAAASAGELRARLNLTSARATPAVPGSPPPARSVHPRHARSSAAGSS